ncbi:MAG: hypothetical protein ACREFP_07790 [Acetobacteraceae bacterium]
MNETRHPVRLVLPAPTPRLALSQIATTWMVRDMINTPANLLGPAELGARFGAAVTTISGPELTSRYPRDRGRRGRPCARPRALHLAWSGSGAGQDAPLVALCGKGVCFDSGGLDVKPAAGMLRLKEDMGGAAVALGLARLVIEADLPIRLSLRIRAVENSVSGSAMRPLDVVRTRHGLTVEVGKPPTQRGSWCWLTSRRKRRRKIPRC